MSTINTTVETSVDALIGVVLKHRPSFSARDQVVLRAAILASPEPEALLADLRKAYVKKTLWEAVTRILDKDPYVLYKPEPKPKQAPKPTPRPDNDWTPGEVRPETHYETCLTPAPKPQAEQPWDPKKFAKWAMPALHNQKGFGRANAEAVVAEVNHRVAAGTLTPACVRANVNNPNFFRAILVDIKAPPAVAPEPTPEPEVEDEWDVEYFTDLAKEAVRKDRAERVIGRPLTEAQYRILAEKVSRMGDWAQDPTMIDLLGWRLEPAVRALHHGVAFKRGGRTVRVS